MLNTVLCSCISVIGIIENILSVIGAISLVLTVIRCIYNCTRTTWDENIDIKDYPPNYDFSDFRTPPTHSEKLWDSSSPHAPIIVFTPINCVISKLKVIALDENEQEAQTIETFKKITPDHPVCFRIERAECLTRYKLKWYSSFGRWSEHLLNENGFSGINSIHGAPYHYTALSFIRLTLGFK